MFQSSTTFIFPQTVNIKTKVQCIVCINSEDSAALIQNTLYDILDERITVKE